jgi:hypothetical protein
VEVRGTDGNRHLGARLAQQRCRLERTLTAADDKDPAAGKRLEIGVLGCVRRQLRRHAVELGRASGEGGEACGHDDAAYMKLVSAAQEEAKLTVRAIDPDDLALIEIRNLVLPEPVGVAQEVDDRDRRRQGRCVLIPVLVEGQAPVGVADARRLPGRAKKHAIRHSLAPEDHRATECVRLDTGRA